jgi:hypothetical protein
MGERRGVYGVLRERNHLGDPGVDGRIMMDIQEVGCGVTDWIDLA